MNERVGEAFDLSGLGKAAGTDLHALENRWTAGGEEVDQIVRVHSAAVTSWRQFLQSLLLIDMYLLLSLPCCIEVEANTAYCEKLDVFARY